MLKEYRREINEIMSQLQQQQKQVQQRVDPMENTTTSTTSDCIIDTSIIIDAEMNAAPNVVEDNKHTAVSDNRPPEFNLETLVRLMKIYLALRHTIYSGCKFD